MKYLFFIILLLFIVISFVKTSKGDNMQISSTGIVNGVIEDKYGKRGTHFLNQMPTYSLPFKIENAPKETKTFAFVLDDKDAIPVAGFTWVHWIGANLKRSEVLENESINASDFIQGQNSWGVNMYGGMAPPNAPHQYDLIVYALDTELPLKTGFTPKEWYETIQGHVLEQCVLSGTYNN